VLDHLQKAAQTKNLPVQVRGTPRPTGTDANAMQITRAGVATGLIGIPNRYMHSPVEVVHLDDLDHAAQIMAEFCLTVTPQMDWIP
jgi:endoglucanase